MSDEHQGEQRSSGQQPDVPGAVVPGPASGGPVPIPTGDALVAMIEGLQRHVQMLSGLKSEYEAQAAELARRDGESTRRMEEASRAEAAAREARAAMDGERESLERSRREIEERSRELESKATELSRREAEIEQSRARATAQVNEELARQLEQERERAGAAARDAEALRASLSQRESELSERGARVTELEPLAAAHQGLLEQSRSLEEELRKSVEQSQALRVEMEQLRVRLEETERAAQTGRETEAQLRREGAEHAQRARDTERRIEEAERTISEMREKAASAAPDEPLRERLRAAEEELDAARDDIARLSLLAERARVGGTGGSATSDPELVAKLNRADGEAASLKARVAELESALDAARGEAQALAADTSRRDDDELEKAGRVIEALQQDRARLAEKLAQAERAAASAAAAGRDVERHTDFPDAALRRERLRRVRAALGAQRGKIDQAKAMLTQRLSEAHDVVTKKAALAAEMQLLEQTRQKIELERAALLKERQQGAGAPTAAVATGSRSPVVPALFASVTLAVLGGVSWLIASAIVKPVCVATMSVGIDERQEPTTPDQAAAWKQYIRNLPEDERFLERAAERFKMRGFGELATGSALDQFLRSNLDVDTSGPKEVRLALKHPGYDRAALAVDTLATTMIGFANDSRDLREDRASTIISQVASAAAEPVEDPRLAVFGALYGVLTAVSLLGAAVVWRRAKPAEPRAARRERVSPLAAAAMVPQASGAIPSLQPARGTPRVEVESVVGDESQANAAASQGKGRGMLRDLGD